MSLSLVIEEMSPQRFAALDMLLSGLGNARLQALRVYMVLAS